MNIDRLKFTSGLLRTAQFDQEYIDYWANLFDDDDKDLAPLFRKLMIKLWEYDQKQVILHKTAACRLIPVHHSVSAKKYIDIAEQKGWISFINDRSDKRKTIVKPAAKLLDLVERHLLVCADKIRNTAVPDSFPTSVDDKILPSANLGAIAQELRTKGQKIVLCHGVFDLLHVGHLWHFQQARRQGDTLFVTLNADRFVDKGPGRPVFPAELRAKMCAAISAVDVVAIVRAADAVPAIRAIRPHAYAKGAEYANRTMTSRLDAERRAVEEFGGHLIFTAMFPVVDQKSAAGALQKPEAIAEIMQNIENVVTKTARKTHNQRKTRG